MLSNIKYRRERRQLNACAAWNSPVTSQRVNPCRLCSRLSEETRQPDGTRLPLEEEPRPRTLALGSLQETSLLIQTASLLSQVEDCKLGGKKTKQKHFLSDSLVKKQNKTTSEAGKQAHRTKAFYSFTLDLYSQ